ncbi:MAG: hypothetical protein ACK49E_17995, partial [Planctomyces sp.]
AWNVATPSARLLNEPRTTDHGPRTTDHEPLTTNMQHRHQQLSWHRRLVWSLLPLLLLTAAAEVTLRCL